MGEGVLACRLYCIRLSTKITCCRIHELWCPRLDSYLLSQLIPSSDRREKDFLYRSLRLHINITFVAQKRINFM